MSARSPSSQHLDSQVLALIDRRALLPGDRLPSVAELANHFSVAPGTMREALRTLQTAGIVDIRHGAGTFVRARSGRLILTNPHHRTLDTAALQELLDARVRIEPHLAELAARRRGETELSRLTDVLETARDHIRARDDMHFQAGMAFHRAIAQTSGHRVMAEVIDSLLEVHSAEQRAIRDIYPDPDLDHAEHCDILEAIRRGNPRLARTRMRGHIQQVSTTVAERMRTPDALDEPPPHQPATGAGQGKETA